MRLADVEQGSWHLTPLTRCLQARADLPRVVLVALFRSGREQAIFCISDMLIFFFPRFQIRCGVAEKEISFVSRSVFSVIGGALQRQLPVPTMSTHPCPAFHPCRNFLGSLPPSKPASSGPCCLPGYVHDCQSLLSQIPASFDSALVFLFTRFPCENLPMTCYPHYSWSDHWAREAGRYFFIFIRK